MTDNLYDETYRPQFHFTPRVNWTNDPNGLVYYKGEYHLFFQHNPVGINWGNMTWGHAVSPDLLHWRQLPNALEPDALGTMFSGSAVVDWHNTTGLKQGDSDTLVAIYTAAGNTSQESQGQPFTQCIATSNDRGRSWTKYAGNPVLGHIVKENRDPKVVWHAPTARWIMALYLDVNRYALFRSPDLIHWTHLHDIEMPECTECPDFFELPVAHSPDETRWVFTAANGRYLIGSFDGTRYLPECEPLQVDFGANYYAVQTYSDTPDSRRIQLAWMAGGQYPDMPFNQQMSFPCELTLRRTPDGLRLYRYPIAELAALRAREHAWHDEELTPHTNALAGIEGELLEIALDLALDGGDFVLNVRGTPITYDGAAGTLSCLDKSTLVAPENGHLELLVLVDRASIELFVNGGRISMTSCFLPTPEDRSITLTGSGGVHMRSIRIFVLKSIWR